MIHVDWLLVLYGASMVCVVSLLFVYMCIAHAPLRPEDYEEEQLRAEYRRRYGIDRTDV